MSEQPAAPDLQEVAAQVSPGNLHRHSFPLKSPMGAWSGEFVFVVHRPTRTQKHEVAQYVAMRLTSAGWEAQDAMNAIDGRYVTIEAYLRVMLDEAPDVWWEKPTGGKAFVTFERVYEEDLDAIWEPVYDYLASFPGARLPIPRSRPERATARP